MPKETFYFSHDYNSRSDKELVKVIMKMGMNGIGIYWCMVEMLYEEGGYLMRTEYERIAFELRSHIDSITQLVETFKLFKYDDEKFWSESVLNRIDKRNSKSIKARESANLRWENANAMRSHSDGNAIKERKENNISINNNTVFNKKNELNNNLISNNLKSIDVILWTDEKKLFMNDFRWKEKFCTDKKILQPDLEKWMHEFLDDLELKDDLKNLKELKNHFTNWYNKKKNGKPDNSDNKKLGTSEARMQALRNW